MSCFRFHVASALPFAAFHFDPPILVANPVGDLRAVRLLQRTE